MSVLPTPPFHPVPHRPHDRALHRLPSPARRRRGVVLSSPLGRPALLRLGLRLVVARLGCLDLPACRLARSLLRLRLRLRTHRDQHVVVFHSHLNQPLARWQRSAGFLCPPQHAASGLLPAPALLCRPQPCPPQLPYCRCCPCLCPPRPLLQLHLHPVHGVVQARLHRRRLRCRFCHRPRALRCGPLAPGVLPLLSNAPRPVLALPAPSPPSVIARSPSRLAPLPRRCCHLHRLCILPYPHRLRLRAALCL